MALKNAFMVKSNLLSAAASLSLTAKPGEGLIVKDLRFGALHSGGFAECLIDRLSVGFWYIGDINANHLEQCSVTGININVFRRLVGLGLFKGYPIAEGETFEVQPHTAGATVVGTIIYEVWDAADIKTDMPNGSMAKEYLFLNYGKNGTEIAIDATGTLDESRNPSEYPAFPFGDVVPANHEIDILGFLLMNWQDAEGNANPNYAYLKLVKDRKTLFDEDRNGICIREGMGQLTWGPCRQTNVDMELFPEPITFKGGDELLVQMTAGDTAIAINDPYLAAVQRVRKLI